MRAVMRSGEKSERILRLTADAIDLNPAKLHGVVSVDTPRLLLLLLLLFLLFIMSSLQALQTVGIATFTK